MPPGATDHPPAWHPSGMDRRSFLLTAGAAAGSVMLGGRALAAPSLAPRAARPRRTIPDPIASLVTRWDTDPWSLGSYSALPPGTSPSVRRTLANAVLGGRVVLAGEYASPDHPSTTTGAYNSGVHAAQRLLDRGVRSVVVIGAGMAGAAAARTLRAQGVDVTVLEARDRVGGRIHSDTAWGTPVELGAAWIHGVRDNPIASLAKADGLRTLPTNYDDAVARDTVTGQPSAEADRRWAAMTALADRIDSDWPPRDQSVGTWLTRHGWKPGRINDWAAAVEITQEYGLDPKALGVRAYSEGAYYHGGDAMVGGGYATIVDRLLSGADVRTGTPVAGVAAGTRSVTVTPRFGAVLTADAAVVAVPLPLLRAQSPRIAPMTRPVTAALGALRTGNLEKVVLRYAEQWWGGRQVYGVVGGGAPGAPAGSLAALRWTEWYSLTDLLGFPALVGFSGGAAARARSRSDAACVAEAKAALAAAFAG